MDPTPNYFSMSLKCRTMPGIASRVAKQAEQAETFFQQALRLNPNTLLRHENLWAMTD